MVFFTHFLLIFYFISYTIKYIYFNIKNFKQNDRPDTKIQKFSFSDLVAKALSFLVNLIIIITKNLKYS